MTPLALARWASHEYAAARGGRGMTLLAEMRLSLVAGAPRRALRYLPPTAFMIDVVAVSVAGAAAALGRDRLAIFDPSIVQVSDTLGIAGPVMMGGWLLMLWLVGGYRATSSAPAPRSSSGSSTPACSPPGWSGSCATWRSSSSPAASSCWPSPSASRRCSSGRYLLRRRCKRARRRGALQHRVVIAGTPAHVDEVAAGAAPRVRGSATRSSAPWSRPTDTASETAAGVPVLGTPTDSCGGRDRRGRPHLRRRRCARLGHPDAPRSSGTSRSTTSRSSSRPSVTDVSSERVRMRPVGGLPLMHIDRPARCSAAAGRQAHSSTSSVAALLVAASRRSSPSPRSGSSCTTAARSCSARPGRPRRRDVRLLQVPHHGRRRRGAARRAAGRDRLRRAACSR